MHMFISGPSFLFHWSICLTVCQYYCLDYCRYRVSFEIKKCEFPYFVVFRDCFGYSGSLHFHMNFRIILSISFLKKEKVAGILILIMLNWQVNFGSIVILRILSLLIHEHRCLSIYIQAFNFFQHCSVISSVQVLHSAFSIYLSVSYSFFMLFNRNFLNYILGCFVLMYDDMVDF